MVKEFCLAWEKNKGKLEEYFRTTKQGEYDGYVLIAGFSINKVRGFNK